MPDVTKPFADAVAEAEALIANAPFIRAEQDLVEGYEYLAGRIRGAIQMAFDHDPDRPVLIHSTHQFARQGLDNPDALYWHANITEHDDVVLRGVRGTTADLNFQVMAGGYGAGGNPGSLAAFDDRELDIADDGSWELHLGPNGRHPGDGATTLLVREVYNDWDAERRGYLWIERPSSLGRGRPPTARATVEKRYRVAAKLLTSTIRTWFAFPDFFQNTVPVNTLSPPASTPGGLTSQRSSIGHYDLEDDEALVVTVPACADCRYQGFQIGSDWYASTDYENHQTSLTKAQARVDDDGRIRMVVSEQDPGITNWLEATGHRTGSMMLRWQVLSRDLGPDDGPVTEVVKVADVATMPWFAAREPGEWERRITARQRAVAARMIS